MAIGLLRFYQRQANRRRSYLLTKTYFSTMPKRILISSRKLNPNWLRLTDSERLHAVTMTACEHCKAKPGERCIGRNGNKVPDHSPRVIEAAKQFA